MSDLGLTEYGVLAQVLLSIVSLVGIVTSMWLSIKALREVQIDRKLRQRPYLGFEIGGYDIPVEFRKAGKTIPGIDPSFVSKVFSDMPDDAESVRLKHKENKDGSVELLFYGQLRNYGLGPALATTVTWVPKEIWLGSERLVLDREKSLEPQYQGVLNCMPSVPSHILPAKEARLARLPTFIEKDFRKEVTRVEGVLRIECKDVFEEKHTVTQTFFLFTYYRSDPPHVHVTFSDFAESE
jgi:hypothetical protein